MISPVSPPDSTSRLRAITDRDGYDYLVALPANYGVDRSPAWPLILFLHGSAFRGSDVNLVGTHGLPRLLSGVPELNALERAAAARLASKFIVIAPQCPTYEVWEDASLLSLMDQIRTDYAVDAGRVYLTGLSMGGFGAWSLGIRHPQRFGAIVPICGGGRVADITTAMRTDPVALQSLGVWAFHGKLDTVVPSDESQRMVDALRAAGVRDVRLTVYPEANHDAWTPSYANDELYSWLLRHKR